jgi:hypothetical protein
MTVHVNADGSYVPPDNPGRSKHPRLARAWCDVRVAERAFLSGADLRGAVVCSDLKAVHVVRDLADVVQGYLDPPHGAGSELIFAGGPRRAAG